MLSGGFSYRKDKLDETTVELKTTQGWGGLKTYLPHQYTVDYRLLYAITDHVGPRLTTDNIVHTASVGKNWPRYGGTAGRLRAPCQRQFLEQDNIQCVSRQRLAPPDRPTEFWSPDCHSRQVG